MIMQLNIATAIVSWLILTTIILPITLSKISSIESVTTFSFSKNPIKLSILLFNNLNILIASCEIILCHYIQFIQSDYKKLKEKYKKGEEWRGCIDYLCMPLPSIFHARSWARMWSTYALYDPSYQNHETFGFFIDVGNGYSTLPGCILFNYAIFYPDYASPLLIGCVGLCMYWQILYGTIIYIFSYVFNKRYEGKRLGEVLAFVGISNSLWICFPIFGLYACVHILRDGDFSVFE